jgi:hypothetical protein
VSTPATTTTHPKPGVLRTDFHDPDLGRPCVHLLDKPPAAFVVNRAAVGRLNFQPRVITRGVPCIASRIGDVLVLDFDVVGPVDLPHPHRGGAKSKHQRKQRWRYTLQPVDDNPDVLLAVQQRRADQ